MIYKKLFVLFLVGLLVVAVGACSKKQTTKVETEPATETVTETTASGRGSPAGGRYGDPGDQDTGVERRLL